MTTAMALFVLSQALYAIQVWHMSNVVRANRDSLLTTVTDDTTAGLSTVYIVVTFLARLNGVVFLLFIAWKVGIFSAVFLFIGSLLAGMVTNVALRSSGGYTAIFLVAKLAVVGVPATAVAAWWLALQG